MDAVTTLRERFGFDSYRAGQREVVDALLGGRSAAAVFPTGSGKSLCFQLPALVLHALGEGITLVVSPLIALMKDQIDALAARGIVAHRLDSSLGAAETSAVLDAARNGRAPLLYVAPERFNNERFRSALRAMKIALLAVDEAHCISEWGHNFRPDYLKLAGYAQEFGARRVLALTATATPRVLDDICAGFRIAPHDAIRTGFRRDNLELRRTPTTSAARDALLLERIANRPRGATIVYVTLQRTAEEVATRLAAVGYPATPYHAGMDDDIRAATQDAFLASRDAIVVATIAFGMGIDKSDIRYVYHYNLPKSLENYSQEVGRAGRDGGRSICEILACRSDLLALENFAYGDTPARSAVEAIVAELFAAPDGVLSLDLRDLSSRHDVRELVVKTLLTYLELDGYLEGGTPEFSRYSFVPKRTSAEILAEFQGEPREFLLNLLRRVEKAKTWFHVEVDSVATELGAPRARVVRALEHLAERGWIELEAEAVRSRYRRMRVPDDVTALAAELHDRMLVRERGEIDRLRQVVELVTTPRCIAQVLAAHFGDTSGGPCGVCSGCDTGGIEWIDEAAPAPATGTIAAARELAAEHGFLREPRALARFLCGISSPRTSRARLGRHALFGAASDSRFADVLAALSCS